MDPNQKKSIYFMVAGLSLCMLLLPYSLVIVSVILLILLLALGHFLNGRYVSSEPNQWLVIINNGRMSKAGIGLKTFINFTDTVVKFPSKIEKITFQARNVTKEMQGVNINGFACWSVYKKDDGPFRCYKYMEGGDANSSVQAMCQSVLRDLIANSTMEDVLRNRQHLRENMLNDLKDQLKGWGVWLETVEITQVTISSEKLFKDLQAEFRYETHLKSQQIQLNAKQKINEAKQLSEMRMSQLKQSNSTMQQKIKHEQTLKRENNQSLYSQKMNKLSLTRLELQNDLELSLMKAKLQKQQKKMSNEQQLSLIREQFDLQNIKKRIEVQKLHDDSTLKKYRLDSLERIYHKLNLNNMNINQFAVGNQSGVNLLNMLPQMSS